MSKTINKILNDKGSDVNNRVRLTREWLKTEYRLKDVKDVKFLEQLSDVHDHDNMALHFGEVKVGTSFDVGYVRIFEVNDGWHLGFSRNSGKDFIIIHPGHEKAGLTADNLKLLNTVKALVKNGSVSSLPATAVTSAPTVTYSSGSVLSVSGLEEEVVVKDALEESPVSANTISSGSTTSLTINMDDYLK